MTRTIDKLNATRDKLKITRSKLRIVTGFLEEIDKMVGGHLTEVRITHRALSRIRIEIRQVLKVLENQPEGK